MTARSGEVHILCRGDSWPNLRAPASFIVSLVAPCILRVVASSLLCIYYILVATYVQYSKREKRTFNSRVS